MPTWKHAVSWRNNLQVIRERMGQITAVHPQFPLKDDIDSTIRTALAHL